MLLTGLFLGVALPHT